VIGRDSNREDVTTYDLASHMIDLDVDLSPKLTNASHTSNSTNTYFQATHVITTQDPLKNLRRLIFGRSSLGGVHGRSKCRNCLGWTTRGKAPSLM
jgi:hypothetical protein